MALTCVLSGWSSNGVTDRAVEGRTATMATPPALRDRPRDHIGAGACDPVANGEPVPIPLQARDRHGSGCSNHFYKGWILTDVLRYYDKR